MNISFRKLTDSDKDYILMHKWCKNKYIYEWFEQRELSLDEINKYIYSKYKADSIVLRPFKRNIRAIKCYEKRSYTTFFEYKGTDTLNNPEIITVLLHEKNTNK